MMGWQIELKDPGEERSIFFGDDVMPRALFLILLSIVFIQIAGSFLIFTSSLLDKGVPLTQPHNDGKHGHFWNSAESQDLR